MADEDVGAREAWLAALVVGGAGIGFCVAVRVYYFVKKYYESRKTRNASAEGTTPSVRIVTAI